LGINAAGARAEEGGQFQYSLSKC